MQATCLADLMSRHYMLALSLLASCASSAVQLDTQSVVPIREAAIAIHSTAPVAEESGDSLLHLGIGGTPMSLVLGYGATNAESVGAFDDVREDVGGGLGTARPYVGFSLSF